MKHEIQETFFSDRYSNTGILLSLFWNKGYYLIDSMSDSLQTQRITLYSKNHLLLGFTVKFM